MLNCIFADSLRDEAVEGHLRRHGLQIQDVRNRIDTRGECKPGLRLLGPKQRYLPCFDEEQDDSELLQGMDQMLEEEIGNYLLES